MTTTSPDAAFQAFLATAWLPSFDGSAADDAAGEPRGNTHYGVVRATWDGAIARGAAVSDPNFDTAPKADFGIVLRIVCWDAINGDRLTTGGAGGVAVVLAAMAMAAGSDAATRLLQRLLPPLAVDGVMGPMTTALTVTGVQAGRNMVDELTTADEAFFASLANAPLYLHGWDRRAEAFAAVARAL